MNKFRKRARIITIAGTNLFVFYEKTSFTKRLKFIKGGGHNNSAAVWGEDYLRSIIQLEEFVSQKT